MDWSLIKKRIFFICLCMAGCSGNNTEQVLEKPIFSFKITASPLLNPDIFSKPSPVVVLFYHLKNPLQFENASFLSLYNQPLETLSNSLINIDEMEIRPKEMMSKSLSLFEEARHIGVVVAFRNISKAQWKTLIEIPRDKEKIMCEDNVCEKKIFIEMSSFQID